MALTSIAPWKWIGPQGEIVRAVVVSHGNPAILYAGTEGRGVFKSMDAGENWSPASGGLTDGYVFALAMDPANPAILYA